MVILTQSPHSCVLACVAEFQLLPRNGQRPQMLESGAINNLLGELTEVATPDPNIQQFVSILPATNAARPEFLQSTVALTSYCLEKPLASIDWELSDLGVQCWATFTDQLPSMVLKTFQCSCFIVLFVFFVQRPLFKVLLACGLTWAIGSTD